MEQPAGEQSAVDEDEKPAKESVAFAVHRGGDRETVLVVRRPEDDEDLPGHWGLPAGSLREEEDWEDAVLRAGPEKLGVQLAVGPQMNEGRAERDEHVLHMRLYDARIMKGKPDVAQEAAGVTRYTDWEWAPPERLEEAAGAGSLCSALYLEWRKAWEGRDPVYGTEAAPGSREEW